MSDPEHLYQSCFDLRWHFNPAAATEAGVVGQNARLGDFDTESMRAHMAAFRSMAFAVEALELDDVEAEIDRTALLNDLRSTIFRFEHEQPHVRNPSFWLSHLYQALYACSIGRMGLRSCWPPMRWRACAPCRPFSRRRR